MSKDGSLFTVYGSPFNFSFVLSEFRGFVIICFEFWILTFIWNLGFDICHLNSFNPYIWTILGFPLSRLF
jgi:hypothetical protein